MSKIFDKTYVRVFLFVFKKMKESAVYWKFSLLYKKFLIKRKWRNFIFFVFVVTKIMR